MVAVLSQCNSSKCPSGAQRKQSVCVSARYSERCSAVRAVCKGEGERERALCGVRGRAYLREHRENKVCCRRGTERGEKERRYLECLPQQGM